MNAATDLIKIAAPNENRKTSLLASKSLLAAEANILTFIDSGKKTGALIPESEFAQVAIKAAEAIKSKGQSTNFSLTDDQNNALKHILTNEDRLIGIQGDAGVGKTTMLQYLKEATAGKAKLTGVATTGKAAAEIESKSGIFSSTIDSFLIEHQNFGHDISTPHNKQVLIIDEASLAGTKKIDQLLKAAEDMDAKVVMIGDRKQLKFDHGHMFGKLQEHGMPTVSMTESIRQKTDLTKSVASAFKDIAMISSGLDRLEAAGKLITSQTHETIFMEPVVGMHAKSHEDKTYHEIVSIDGDKIGLKYGDAKTVEHKKSEIVIKNSEHIVDKGLQHIQDKFVENLSKDYQNDGLNSSMGIVDTNADRKVFNAAIRNILKESGVIGKEVVTFTMLDNKSLSPTDQKFVGNYQTGNVLIPNGDHDPELRKGKKYEIAGIDREKNELTIIRNTNEGVKNKIIKGEDLSTFSAYEKADREFSIGDKIVFDRNYSGKNIQNGHVGTILAMDQEKGSLTIQKGKEEVELKLKEYQHINHGYVSTTFKAQGGDALNVHVIANPDNPLNNYSAAYVSGTRAVNDLTFYTTNRKSLEEKYSTDHTPQNAIDHIPASVIKQHADVAKIASTAAEISQNVTDFKRPDADINIEPRVEDILKNQRIKEAFTSTLTVSRIKQLELMEKKLVEFGRLDFDKSREHAIEYGYNSRDFMKAVDRMEHRLGQLERDGFVTRPDSDRSFYIFNEDKADKFKNDMHSLTAATERHLIASNTFKENFKESFEKYNSDKAFIGRKYGKGAQAEVNSGIDKILNEAFAGAAALVSATTKFVVNKVVSLAISNVKSASLAIKAFKNYDPERSNFQEYLGGLDKNTAKEFDPTHQPKELEQGFLRDEYHSRSR